VAVSSAKSAKLIILRHLLDVFLLLASRSCKKTAVVHETDENDVTTGAIGA
jgi:hypothetical protein